MITHYLIFANKTAHGINATSDSDAMEQARNMGVADMVVRIDPAMSEAEFGKMELPENNDELQSLTYEAIAHLEPEQIKARMKERGTLQHIVSRFLHRSYEAQRCRYVSEAGIIGVGLITFRDARIARMSRLIRRMCAGNWA